MDYRGIHRVDADLEAPQQALAFFPGGKGRVDILEVSQLFPEQLFREGRVAFLVGVGEAVARWRAQAVAGEYAELHAQPVADVVETDGMGKLGEKHRGQMINKQTSIF